MENDEAIMGGGRMLVLRKEHAGPAIPDAFADLRAFGAPIAPGTFRVTAFSNPSLDETPVVDEVQVDEEDIDGDAAALPMPLTLIEPASDVTASVDSASFLADAQAQQVSWGIDAIGAQASPWTGEGVTVAVLDTGIQRDHPAFNDPELEIVEKDFTVEPDQNGDYPNQAVDQNGHGTHCAGTVFGRDVDGVRIGVAPGVKKALIAKVIGGRAGTKQLYEAMDWALNNGANVISMSLGFDHGRYFNWLIGKGVPQPAAISQTLNVHRDNIRLFDATMARFVAVGQSLGHRAIVVAASGNEANRPAYVVSKSSPSAAVGIVAVGAVQKANGGFSIARFSNSEPDFIAPGVGVVSAGIEQGKTLVSMNGTSMACPHVAGLAALEWQKLSAGGGEASPISVKSELNVSARAKRENWFPGVSMGDIGAGMPSI